MRKGVVFGCIAGGIVLCGTILFFLYRMLTTDPFDDDFDDYLEDLYEDDDVDSREYHDISKESVSTESSDDDK